MQSEADYRNVQMVVNYSDVVALANGNDMSQEELAQELQQRGVSAILHKEWSLGDLANNGQVSMQYGGNIKNANFYGQISKDVPVNDATLYVAILDSTVAEQVQKHTLHPELLHIRSVSYTHLDVYKRQRMQFLFWVIFFYSASCQPLHTSTQPAALAY